MTVINFRGTDYNSNAEVAYDHGIKPATLQARLDTGDTLEEAVDKGSNVHNVTVAGKEYRSLLQVADAYGIDGGVLTMRVRTGMTLEDALELGGSAYTVTLYGKSHKNRADLADYYGIDTGKLESRLYKRGESLEDAVHSLLTTEPLKFKGKEYPTLARLCNEYGVSAYVVTKRLKRGWSMEDAILRPIEQRASVAEYAYRGETYGTRRELADDYGLTVGYIDGVSKKLGVTYIEALDRLVTFLDQYGGNRPTQISKTPFIIYNDEWFSTLKELCDYVGVTHSAVKGYMRRNGEENHLKALENMTTLTRDLWIDVDTGEQMAKDKLEKKYKSGMPTLVKKGLAKKDKIALHPTCTFKVTGYCAIPGLDIDEYLTEVSNKRE